jgi:hypothetical protein
LPAKRHRLEIQALDITEFNFLKKLKTTWLLLAWLSLVSVAFPSRLKAQENLTGNNGREVISVDLSKHVTLQSQVEFQQLGGFGENTPMAGKPKSARVGAEIFRIWLDKSYAPFALGAARNNSQAVLCIKGQWDHADKALENFGLPYLVIKGSELDAEKISRAKVIIVNCGAEIERNRLQLLRDFVNRGGFVLSTDWALDSFTDKTFPGFIAWNKGINHHDIYRAYSNSMPPAMARGLVRHAFWKLDQESHLIKVLRPDAVKLLVSSKDLAREDPDGAGILACQFNFGRGEVLHMVGHFDNNGKAFSPGSLPDPSAEMGISLRQGLAANFVMRGLLAGVKPVGN